MWMVSLTWQGRDYDHQGGRPRARHIHSTPDVLIPAIPQMWETRQHNSVIVRDGVRDLPYKKEKKRKCRWGKWDE